MQSVAELAPTLPRYAGYYDLEGRFVSFAIVDQVFVRARSLRLRTLLCLELDDRGELKGTLYANLGASRRRSAARLDPLTR